MSKYNFPCIRGIQSGRLYFQINVPFKTLCNLLRIDTGLVMERSQREVNHKRANGFSKYLQNNRTTAITTSLTGVIDTPEGFEKPLFTEANESMPNVGMLSVDVAADLLLFDGQHRSTGIYDAVNTMIEIGSDCVPLMLFPEMELWERQLAFVDINLNAVKPAASINDAYNHRDPLARLAVELSTECVCFKDLVDFERNTVSEKGDKLYPLKTIKEATASLLGLSKSYKGEITEGQKAFAKEFWNLASREMHWGGLKYSLKSTKEIRDTQITTHSVFTRAIGLMGNHLAAQYGDIDNMPLKRLNDVNYSRHSDDFQKRCIDPITTNMIVNATAVKLTAIKLLMACGCPLTSDLKSLESDYFGRESVEEYQRTAFDGIKQEANQEPQEEATQEAPETALERYSSTMRQALVLPGHWTEEQHFDYMSKFEKLCNDNEIDLADYVDWINEAVKTMATKISTSDNPSRYTHLNSARALFKSVIVAKLN